MHPPIREALALRCGVQHYDWGDREFIPTLLGRPNPDQRPFAELWMGAHPDLPSVVLPPGVTAAAAAPAPGEALGLDVLIERDPVAVLGVEVARRFGSLPYLFKILSAAGPLSIQAHPSRERARQGFAREEAAGIERDAARRSYKDDNHKPELLVALTEFWALRGFRPLPEIAAIITGTPELAPLWPEVDAGRTTLSSAGLQALYARFMQRPQAAVDAILEPLVERLRARHRQHRFPRDTPEHWLLVADAAFSDGGNRDRGLLSMLLLNLVRLQPGQGIYLPAGVLHAYLCGTGVELMANSNNVLRGGLTAKHVDVQELLGTLVFDAGPPVLIEPSPAPGGPGERYPTPAPEFELRRVDLAPGETVELGPAASAEIAIPFSTAADASLTVTTARNTLVCRRGEPCLLAHGVAASMAAGAAPLTVYRATTPPRPT